MVSRLTLAVAGGRKTQAIADHCASLPLDRHAAVLTYTQNNQRELESRIARYAGDHLNIDVMGWFTFLLRHFARPFLPFKFPGKRVLGFNFDGAPGRYATGMNRFLDSNGYVYRCELARLAHELIDESGGAAIHRLQCIYQEIFIDEVQDLSAHDLEILDILIQSAIDIRMVGDVRQSVLSTNARSAKNKKYGGAKIIDWFREREKSELLEIGETNTTWRCRPEIAEFSDRIFDNSWSFAKTESRNSHVTSHDGIFLVRSEHVAAYVATYKPQCLRHSASSGKGLDLDFLNFTLAKGSTHDRILIVPTKGIEKFLARGEQLEAGPAAIFYVAVTRAAQSVAIVMDDPEDSTLPYWSP
jgi:hypothetical protein